MLPRETVRHAIAEAAPRVVERSRTGLNNILHLWNYCAYDEHSGTYLARHTQSAAAVWSGQLAETFPVSSIEHPAYHVCAIDGSQIYSDHHMGVPAYLLHIAHAQMQFGENAYADIASQPYVYIDEDFASRAYVDMMRLKHEISYGSLAPPGSCVMFDGPLTWWSLAEENCIQEACSHLNTLYDNNVWSIGYMSSPRFHHITNAVRALVHTNLCDSREYACVEHIPDVQLLENILPMWHRTRVFGSTDTIVYQYPEHVRPHFCYMHTGNEVVRIDIPHYISKSRDRVDAVIAIVRNQIEKGHGYPVALSEAHEAAVIREPDRQFFFTMLSYYTNSKHTSYKQQLKHAPVM